MMRRYPCTVVAELLPDAQGHPQHMQWPADTEMDITTAILSTGGKQNQHK